MTIFKHTAVFAILLFMACSPKTNTVLETKPSIRTTSSVLTDYENYQKEEREKNRGQWSMESDEDRLSKKLKYAAWINELNQISSTDQSEQITKDLLVHELKHDVFDLEYGIYTMPLNAEGGFISGILFSLSGSRIKNDEDFEKYISRIEAFPAYIDMRIADMRSGQSMNKSRPKVVVDNCIDVANYYLKNAETNNPFLADIKVSDEQKNKLASAIAQHVTPSFLKLKTYLKEEYRNQAPDIVGISNISGGKELYEERVRYFTTLDISPDEVYNIGLNEVARIKSEMEEVKKTCGFEGNMAEFFAFLRSDPQFYCTDPQDLLEKAAWISKKIEGILPQYFGKLTSMPFTVKPVAASIAPTYTTGRYSGGSFEDRRAGEYWVNTYKLESRPLYVLPSLTLHEAVPGHHLQGMLADENQNLSAFRRNTYLSAFGEGWGLYSEYLGKEMGIYETPYEDFGRLTYEMWRACRLVVDVGMHYKGWTRDQALEYMAGNTALSLHEVRTEIDRYIGWPGQALSYKMGELKIRELRKRAEDKLGDKFSLRDFHDLILENGSVTMRTLESLVDQYISKTISK